MKAENALLGTVNESGVSSWNTSFYIPSSTYSKTTIDSKTAESNTTMVIVDKGSKKYYIQTAYMLRTEEKMAQEIRPFLKIKDSFKKIVIT